MMRLLPNHTCEATRPSFAYCGKLPVRVVKVRRGLACETKGEETGRRGALVRRGGRVPLVCWRACLPSLPRQGGAQDDAAPRMRELCVRLRRSTCVRTHECQSLDAQNVSTSRQMAQDGYTRTQCCGVRRSPPPPDVSSATASETARTSSTMSSCCPWDPSSDTGGLGIRVCGVCLFTESRRWGHRVLGPSETVRPGEPLPKAGRTANNDGPTHRLRPRPRKSAAKTSHPPSLTR